MKLSLAMICKNELQNLKRLQPIVTPYIDEWVVVFPPNDEAIDWAKDNNIKVVVKDFTEAVDPDIRTEMEQWGIETPEDYRIFNFAAARNESFSHTTGDYILWLDADDGVVGLKNLKQMIESLSADMYEVLYDYARDEEGNSISNHIRERIIKNNNKFEWRGGELGLIHETLTPKEGESPYFVPIDPKAFRIVHNSDHPDESSMRNHRALLYEYLKTKGKDPRTTYYLGTEFFNRRQYAESIKILQEYIEVGGWDEERYRAYMRMGEAYHQLNDSKSSRNCFLKAIEELPHYLDAYLGLGESYFAERQWAKAIEHMRTALSKPLPVTKSAIDKTKYTFRPCTFIALAHLNNNNSKEAYEWYQRAKALNPKHPWVIEYESLFEEAKDLDDYIRSFVKLGQVAQKYYPRTLSALADAVPEDLQDQELLLEFKRRFTKPKIWPDNSIAYFCSQSFEDWGPDALERGCGGSEEAVIHLTKRWADMGYDVTVFNNCPKETTKDGVKWRRYETFNPRDIFNIVIGWRNNPFLDPVVANKKFVDAHDVPDIKFFPKESLKDVTVMAKSDYHKQCFKLPEGYVKVVPNGIDTEQFADLPEKMLNNFVWTSSYDRGLEYLLNMWPEIRKKDVNATLDVAYGLNLFDASPRGKTEEGRAWKRKILTLLDQPGITHHGRLNSADVAKLYKKADFWAYPTDFPEIDCITATKAMTAKAIPITTDVAVLKDRNQGILVEGPGHDSKVQQQFLKEVQNLMDNPAKKEEIRNKIDTTKYNWDNIAKQWAELFDED